MVKHPFIVYDETVERCVRCGIPVPLGMGYRNKEYLMCSMCADNVTSAAHSMFQRGCRDIGPGASGDGRIVRKAIGVR
jgi:hypothetical protein